MPNVDLNGAIQRMVSAEVERAFGPYRELLERLAEFAGGRGGRRAAPARKAEGRGRGRARAAGTRRAAAGAGDASRFKEGQPVLYKQGRGIFEATVHSVDLENNVLTLQRAKDGKKVDRPAAKIYEV